MILSCPSCDTRYTLDVSTLRPGGQTVRCFKCKHSWVQDRPEVEDDLEGDFDGDIGEDDEPLDLDDFEPRPVDRQTGKPIKVKTKSKIGGIVNWVLFFLIFGGAITSAVVYRDVVRKAWPVSNRLYTLIGLGVEAPGEGFELRGVQSKRGKKDDVPFLAINGEITNISRNIREVPVFSGELTNSAGEQIHGWTFTIRQKNLLPGESVPFKTVVENLPKGATGLNITFLAPERTPKTVEEKEGKTEATMEENTAEEAAEDTAGEAAEDTAGEAAEDTAGEAAEDTAGEGMPSQDMSPGNPPEESSGNPPEESSEEPPEKSPEEPSENPPEE